ncbi:hypothetical protein ACHAXN_006010 [Cyclotella atomus]
MVRRGRAHLQKQGGMLASIGGDEPLRKENLHSNKEPGASATENGKSAKVAQTKVKLQPKVSQPKKDLSKTTQTKQQTQLAISPAKQEATHTHQGNLSPLMATPSAPLSSVKINIPTESSSSNEGTIRRELFQSPLSSVSSSAADSLSPRRDSPASTCGSSKDSDLSHVEDTSLKSVNKTQTSTDSRSIKSEEDEEYGSCDDSVNSNSDSDSESESNNSCSGSNSDDETNNSVASEASPGSCEEHIPEHEYEEDDDYSVEVDESEDELEFDEESDDDEGKKRGRPSNKNGQKSKNGATKTADASRMNRAKLPQPGNRLNKSIKSSAVAKERSNDTEESSDESSRSWGSKGSDAKEMENSHVDGNEESDAEVDRENSCDFEGANLEESAEQNTPNEPPKDMASYISTLHHTQIKTSKSSSKRFTKVASSKEPTTSQVLSVVDQLFGMIEDINTVTVGDIVHSVAKHFGVHVKKEMKKAIKARLTELIRAKAAGVTASKPRSIDDKPKEKSKARKPAVAKKQKEVKQADSDVENSPTDPTDSEVIALVDELFEATDGDTVYFSDIVGSVASHFGLSQVKKPIKRLIRDRFAQLIEANDSGAGQLEDPKGCEANEAPALEHLEEESCSAKETNETSKGNTPNVIDGSPTPACSLESPKSDHGEECNSFGGVDSLFDGDFGNENDHGMSPAFNNETCDSTKDQLSTIDHTPHADKHMKSPGSLIFSADSRDKSLAGEHLKCNDSFMSCETTLFKNLSPECLKSNSSEPIDHLMGSLSTTYSLSSTSESRRIEKGKWSLGNEIGSGSFGVVHVGMNAVDGSLMAVKVLRIPSNNKSVIVQELQREIDLMRSLNHPNIVQYLGAEVDTKNNILNIFQEWVAGGSVSSLLKKFGAFSPAVVRSYTTQILQGLDYLHSHHIIHRDIKGGNILISNDGSVKLADFGASKRVEAFGTDPDKMMEELTVRGTPYFMAPEVFEEKYGPKADVWSVGGVVFQMATGSPPWKDLRHKNPISLFFHLKNTEGPPETSAPINDRYLNDLIAQCFQRHPSKRPDTKALLNELLLNHSPSIGTDVGKVPEKNQLMESPQQTDGVQFLDLQDTSLSDSLCYSLTLPVPLPVGKQTKNEFDTSDWPDWAKKSYQLTSSRPKCNPFSRS